MDELMRRLLFLPPRGSTLAGDIDHLHYSVIIVTMIGAAGVALTAGLFVARYPRRGGGPARTARVRTPLWAEAGMIAAVMALFLAWFYIGFGIYARMVVPPEDAPGGLMTVYVVGKQWMWQFGYADGSGSVGRLVVPAGRPVKLLLTSRDVIHSFFVPAFRLKQDAVPGTYTTAWFEAPAPGIFPVYCAEYCGASHSAMRAEVEVMAADAYERWSSGREPTATPGGGLVTSLASRGRDVAAGQGCLQCHAVGPSPGGPTPVGPSWIDLFGKVETLSDGARVLVDEAYISESMMDPGAKIVAGYEPVMPTYRGRVGPAETAAIIEYMKTLSRHAGPRVPANPRPEPGSQPSRSR